MKPVQLAIDGVLDLHTFRPAELPDLLEDYISACIEEGLFSLRIIHGKGGGILKKRVRSLLARDRRVAAFRDAPPQAGGWGATLVDLHRNAPPNGTSTLDPQS